MSKLTAALLRSKKCGLFAERKNIEEIQGYINQFPKEERVALLTIMGMTTNTLLETFAKIAEE